MARFVIKYFTFYFFKFFSSHYLKVNSNQILFLNSTILFKTLILHHTYLFVIQAKNKKILVFTLLLIQFIYNIYLNL